MKACFVFSTALLSVAAAFPANLLKGDISEDALAEITALAAKIAGDVKEKRDFTGVFNADRQRVDTTGKHAYMAPGPNDLRGPCPGMNALANHGYISRTGVDTVVAMTTASNKVFGMGLDLSAFLSIYSGVMAGDILTLSIGGKPKSGLLSGLTSSLGLLGEQQGLSGSHNRFEADASPTRADLYKTGDPVSLDLSAFEQLVATPLGPNGYDTTVLNHHRGARFNESISTNGRFFAGPFTHLAVNSAAHLFTYRFFSNFSSEHPDGYLDLETLKSFEGVTGEPGSFEWKEGRERIPENWYRRPDDYSIISLNLDTLGTVTQHPYLLSIGGNTGEPNTFTGVRVTDLTGGIFNAASLLEGNNLMCFALQAANVGAPDILRGLIGNTLAAVQKLTDALKPVIASLACPQLVKYDTNLLKAFPGAEGGV